MKLKTTSEKGGKIRISEIFSSIQGEGLLSGTASAFVRTSGCNLRCWFCDTRYASWEPEGEFLSIDDIAERAHQLNQTHIVLTGGEPMIYAQIDQLCECLKRNGAHLTIETAGTMYRSLPCDLMSISPKLSNSTPSENSSSWRRNHEQRRQRSDVVRQLIAEHNYQLKFVVDSLSDCEEILDYLEQLGAADPGRVLAMPQGTSVRELSEKKSWLESWCHEHKIRYCPRSHIEWFGNRRGT